MKQALASEVKQSQIKNLTNSKKTCSKDERFHRNETEEAKEHTSNSQWQNITTIQINLKKKYKPAFIWKQKTKENPKDGRKCNKLNEQRQEGRKKKINQQPECIH